MKSSLFKNTLYKVVLNACNLLIPLLVGPHLAYVLDKELYGVYNRVYAEFGMFLTFAGFGIYNYGVREISRIRNDKRRFNQVFTSLFIIGILANVIVGTVYVVYFMMRATSSIDTWLYLVMLIQIIGNMFYIEFVNEAVENYGFIAKKTIIIRVLYFIAIFMFVQRGSDIIIYAIIVSLTVFANNVVSYLYIKKQIKFDFSNLQFGVHIVPLVVTLIYSNAEMLYTQLDKVMLGPYTGSDISVTEYTLATTVVGMLAIIPTSLISVAIPRLSHYIGEHDEENYKSSLINVTSSFMSISIPMFIGVAVLAEEVMAIYTRDVYTSAYIVLIIAVISRLVTCYFAVSSNLVMYINSMEKPLLVMSIIGGVVNVCLNFSMVHIGAFTTVTAAVTTLFANLIETVLIVLYTKKKLGICYEFFSKRMIGYYLAGLTFIPVAYFIKKMSLGYIWNVVVIMPLCILIYGTYLIMTKDPLLQTICQKFHLPFFKA